MPVVDCTLSVNSSSTGYAATVTVLNSTHHQLKLYKVFLPTDGIPLADMFVVMHSGARLRYEGAMAKLPAKPSNDDFLSVPPGERRSSMISLAGSYDLTSPGQYTARYSISHPQPGGGYLNIASNEVSFTIKSDNPK